MGALIVAERWYVITNPTGMRCLYAGPDRRGCGQVHAYITWHCQPVAYPESIARDIAAWSEGVLEPAPEHVTMGRLETVNG